MRYRYLTLLIVAAALAFMAGAYQASVDATSHNALGGYRDACGELPGMIGDDC
jgi:hypothetical protein